jgi:hypothetical protein
VSWYIQTKKSWPLCEGSLLGHTVCGCDENDLMNALFMSRLFSQLAGDECFILNSGLNSNQLHPGFSKSSTGSIDGFDEESLTRYYCHCNNGRSLMD